MTQHLLKRLSFAAPLLLAFAILIVPAIAVAQTLSPEKQQEIQRHCSSAQFNLGQVQKSDAVSRINRGRAYDQMLRQISAFNSRLAYNKINQPQFIQITSDLQAAIDQFRITFTRYDEQLTNAIKISCKEKTVEFYDYIVKAREERKNLGVTTAKINELMAKYRTATVDYQKTLLAEVSP